MTKSKAKPFILLTLVVFFLFSNIFIPNKQYFEFNEKDLVQINQSGFWDLTGSPIFVDDSDPNYNWSKTAAENDWCSGSGNWTNPYIIENVTINGQGSSNCIEIKNSDAYFIIRNCTVYNSGSHSVNATLKLYYVNNGKIISNNCSDNNNNGIYLDSSSNNTLSENTANNNDDEGIKLYNSANNSLSGNNASNNEYGIYLGFSNNNTISGNTASNNDGGIDLYYSNYNTISGNNASNNNYRGIYLGYSNYNTISGNTANNNNYGINLNGSNNNTISGNNASNNNEVGITLYAGSENNSLLGNNINNNNYSGILLFGSNNNVLSGNLMSYCGISLEASLVEMASHSIDNTNLVNNKPVYYYVNELGLGSSNFTDAGQIILVNCNNSIISGLNISDGSGIFLGYSNNITFSGNTISNNSYGIILDSNSKSNLVFLNYFINNDINAEDNGINNTWDNGTIGNYWDDYDGVDANDDGIGDKPHTISGTAGSQDNFPIWADGDEEIPEDQPIISFGNYYILFTFITITILSFVILEKRKKK